MKKIFVMMAAAVAALGFTSCSNEVEEVAESSKELKVNVSVADLNMGAQTRAVKTGWEDGDKINIWYKGNTQLDPDLVIKYDGTNWAKDASATVSGKEPSESGEICFVYEGGNDLSKYEKNTSLHAYRGTMNLVFSSNSSHPTTYTYSEGVLSFEIGTDNWYPQSEFQVVVTGIDPTKYQLKCSNLLKFVAFGVNINGISTANDDYDQYVSGVANPDGAAFYFKGAKVLSDAANYVFTIKNLDTNEEKTYTVTGKAVTNAFTAIKIDASKFGIYEYVTIGDLKWAKKNVGAETAKDWGDYFAWGETEPRYTSYTSNGTTLTFAGWKTAHSKGYSENDFPTYTGSTLDAEHDAATANWGGNWRTPTKEEFEAMYNATTWTWDDTDNGYYVTKKDEELNSEKSNALLFFPAAGYILDTIYKHGSKFGSYWTSTQHTGYTTRAYYLSFTMGSFSYGYKYMGYTIRPVSD